jgi:hypothetical protein
VKREPTVPNITDFLEHLRWPQEQNVAASAFASIPNAKVKQRDAGTQASHPRRRLDSEAGGAIV